MRDQRCSAVEPAVVLAPAKQRELCVVAAHRTCATYLAAQERSHASHTGSARARARDADATLWPATRSTLLVLEPERTLLGLSRSRTRAGGQIVLIGLMVVAFLALIVARTAPSSPTGGAASASAIALGTPSPTTQPTVRPSATAAPSASPQASATARPATSSTPGRNGGRYRVKSGDTLLTIAAKFGTTIKVLKRLNDITDPRVIHPGQVLIVPAR